MIEEGRRKRPMLPRNERLCNTCNKLDDEIHYLIECDKYKYERVEQFKTITEEVPNFELMPDSTTKFIFLMTQENEKILNLIASCTHEWFKIKNTPIVGIWNDIKNPHLSYFTNRNEQKQFNDNIQEEIIKLKDKLTKTEDEVTVIKGEVTILKNENNLLKEEINKITTDEKKSFTNLKQENKQLIQRINKDLSDHVEKIKNKKIEHNPKLNELEKTNRRHENKYYWVTRRIKSLSKQ